jgi:hypothetical protein
MRSDGGAGLTDDDDRYFAKPADVPGCFTLWIDDLTWPFMGLNAQPRKPWKLSQGGSTPFTVNSSSTEAARRSGIAASAPAEPVHARKRSEAAIPEALGANRVGMLPQK